MKKDVVLALLSASYAQAHPASARRSHPPPALNLSSSTVSNLQVALFLEHAEAAYFREVVGKTEATAKATVNAVLREDEIHRQALHDILATAGAQPVSACQYSFSRYNESALAAVGQTLSAVRTGAALDLLVTLPTEDAVLAPGLAAMAAAEARHQSALSADVWKAPGDQPFDASVPASWAFNVVHDFVVPDSCSPPPPAPVLPPLKGHVTSNGTDAVLKLRWQTSDLESSGISVQPLFISWLGRPGGPVHTPMRLVNKTSGEWAVPEGVRGTTFVALTTQAQFTTYLELGRQVVAGPVVVTVRHAGNGTAA